MTEGRLPVATCPYYDPERAQDRDQARGEARDRRRECVAEDLREQMGPMRDQMQERMGEMGTRSHGSGQDDGSGPDGVDSVGLTIP